MKAISNSKECPRCGGGHKAKPFCLYTNGWYCFSCGYTKTADRSFSVLKQTNNIPEFPDAITDFSKFSVEAQIWLTQYGITAELVQQYNILYCGDNSLIFPCFNEEGGLVCYQKRRMGERFITTYGQKRPYILKSLVDTDVIVFVEDYISAIRAHQAGYNVLCLWGTKLSIQYLKGKFTYYNKYLVWLDNDAEKEVNSGQEAAKTILNTINYILRYEYGYSGSDKKAVNIISEKDPKCYNSYEIQHFIKGALQ